MNNHHQNARTTFYSRMLMVERVLKEGKKIKEVAQQLGVSRRTVCKWLARYRQGGEEALNNRGSQPHNSPRRMPVEPVALIAAMRRMRMSGPAIAFSLSLPISSVTLELRRLGLNRLSCLEPKAPIMRYEHESPGDMIHLDIKKLGRIDVGTPHHW